MPKPRRLITTSVNILLRPDQLQWLEEEAARQGISRAEFLRRILDSAAKGPQAR